MLFVILMPGLRGAWRSLVAHLLWEQGVGGSNPLAPTATPPCGCSSTVEPQPSKLVMGVRFPSPALSPDDQLHLVSSRCRGAGPLSDGSVPFAVKTLPRSAPSACQPAGPPLCRSPDAPE